MNKSQRYIEIQFRDGRPPVVNEVLEAEYVSDGWLYFSFFNREGKEVEVSYNMDALLCVAAYSVGDNTNVDDAEQVVDTGSTS